MGEHYRTMGEPMTAVVLTETVIDFAVAHISDWELCDGCEGIFRSGGIV